MNTKIFLLFIILQLFTKIIFGQVSGKVYDINSYNDTIPLIGANVYYPNTTIGTITDNEGYFTLKELDNSNKIVVSYIGYKNDTVDVLNKSNNIAVFLIPGTDLDEVVISKRVQGTYISALKPIQTEVISLNGLEKLACCNLSESFENSATIDVNYSDAISGAKQIKMLGLDGKYAQLLTENIPLIRGISLIYGLNQIPGSWLESIQISKGTSSVINGYESISGQINMELKKPEKTEPLFVNLYLNSDKKIEGNLISAIHLNDKWSTMLLTHGSFINNPMDDNDDGFIDIPYSNFINIFNRWNFQTNKLKSQFGFGYLKDKGRGGQFDYLDTKNDDLYYGIEKDINNYQFFGKTGYSFKRPLTSLGFIAGFNQIDLNSTFGLKNYFGKQDYFYANLIFNSFIKNTSHQYSTGISYSFDSYYEIFQDDRFDRIESISGIFGQYTYNGAKGLTAIAGFRLDGNSYYGILLTPRIHLKYDLNEKSTLRASAGKGYRSANVFTENISTLASSRKVFIDERLGMENAWNFGLNYNYKIYLNKKEFGNITFDFYRTKFLNQVITDLEQNSREVHFYNLNGKSYSNSFQAQLSIIPFIGLDILIAYRLNDVMENINYKLINKPFVNKHKGLLSVSYSTMYDKWQFDFTGQYNGKKNIPNTKNNPVEYQYEDVSPGYFIIHSQVTRRFKYLELYTGVENLTNFKQSNPIISAEDPFSDYFDASMVWGPITGRMFYIGLRYKLNN